MKKNKGQVMNKKYAILALMFLVSFSYAVSQKYDGSLNPSTPPTIEVLLVSPEGKEVVVHAEFATNKAMRNLGLMHRHSLAKMGGMLFVWPDKGVRSFWMKNTNIPLDMIFMNDTNVHGLVKNALPHTLTPRAVKGVSNAVLEVNAGFADRHGITKGWKVMYSFTNVVE
ncbi:MAG: uncharacterized membrane protein (UPF0127 family) [Alphaproteobacteria bacterium]|jgi:uncharacterized membrane protein (UPF0127 family)